MTPERRRNVFLYGFVLLVALGTTFSIYAFRANNAGPAALNVGDCINAPAEAFSLGQVDRTSCLGDHDGEVFAVITHTAPAEAPYPAVAEFGDLGLEQCVPILDSYTGMDVATFIGRGLDFRVFYPAPDHWNRGVRTVACFLIKADGSKLTGSIRSAGTASPSP